MEETQRANFWAVENRNGGRVVVEADTPADAQGLAVETLGVDLVHVGHAAEWEKTP